MGTKEHWNVANSDPKGMAGMIYVGEHYALLLAKYISCGPHCVREEDS